MPPVKVRKCVKCELHGENGRDSGGHRTRCPYRQCPCEECQEHDKLLDMNNRERRKRKEILDRRRADGLLSRDMVTQLREQVKIRSLGGGMIKNMPSTSKISDGESIDLSTDTERFISDVEDFTDVHRYVSDQLPDPEDKSIVYSPLAGEYTHSIFDYTLRHSIFDSPKTGFNSIFTPPRPPTKVSTPTTSFWSPTPSIPSPLSSPSTSYPVSKTFPDLVILSSDSDDSEIDLVCDNILEGFDKENKKNEPDNNNNNNELASRNKMSQDSYDSKNTTVNEGTVSYGDKHGFVPLFLKLANDILKEDAFADLQDGSNIIPTTEVLSNIDKSDTKDNFIETDDQPRLELSERNRPSIWYVPPQDLVTCQSSGAVSTVDQVDTDDNGTRTVQDDPDEYKVSDGSSNKDYLEEDLVTNEDSYDAKDQNRLEINFRRSSRWDVQPPAYYVALVPIPHNLRGLLVGKSGDFLQKMLEVRDTSVSQGSEYFTVQGSSGGVEVASRIIEQQLINMVYNPV